MAIGGSGFLQRMLGSKLLGELIEYLPPSARDSLVDVRDYVQEHGRFPKFEPLRTKPLGASESAQALGAFLGSVEAGASLRMVNLLKGELRGGEIRGVNLLVGDIHTGSVRGTNIVVGAVHGGDVRGLNVLLGNVHGGQLRGLNVLVGDVHGGDVKCQVLIGDVYAGRVQAKLMRGQVHGGEVQVERTLDE